MKCLITGSNGFIGSHLFWRLINKGYDVKGIDNLSHPCKNNVPFEYADIRYIKELRPHFKDIDTVFHLAAQISVDKSIDNPEETIATNVIGTQNILELAKDNGVKVVFASSSEIYGESKKDFMDESHSLNPQSPYAASKVFGDRLCYAYMKTYGMKIAVIRNFNTFGEYQSDDSYGGVISKFTKAALKGEPLYIYGDGKQERDYMYISDALQAYELMMDKEGFVNFGTGKTITVNALAEAIVGLTKSSSRIVHIEPRAGEVQRLCAGIDKAKGLGFQPKTDFIKDLERYISWKKR